MEKWRTFIVLVLSLNAQIALADWGAVTLKPDCSKCPSISEELSKLKANAHDSAVQLQEEKEAVKKVPLDQDVKIRQMTSHLFVDAAKAEIDENLLKNKEKEWQFNCSHCGANKVVKKNKN